MWDNIIPILPSWIQYARSHRLISPWGRGQSRLLLRIPPRETYILWISQIVHHHRLPRSPADGLCPISPFFVFHITWCPSDPARLSEHLLKAYFCLFSQVRILINYKCQVSRLLVTRPDCFCFLNSIKFFLILGRMSFSCDYTVPSLLQNRSNASSSISEFLPVLSSSV